MFCCEMLGQLITVLFMRGRWVAATFPLILSLSHKGRGNSRTIFSYDSPGREFAGEESGEVMARHRRHFTPRRIAERQTLPDLAAARSATSSPRATHSWQTA